ncbi:MAG: DUF2029 domain-containing protein, partial [Candidatus Eisenbacteria sp.]|nr:DUF2029 domain-containing protein [Candidatus Eisenbacteria bacterium]
MPSPELKAIERTPPFSNGSIAKATSGQSADRSPCESYARIALMMILVGVAVRVLMMVLAKGTLIDDAYISLRYARNLCVGRGMVYNVGEHVLGAPPLYVVVLGFLWQVEKLVFGSSGEHIGYFVSGLNVLLTGWAGWLLFRLVRPTPRYLSLLPLMIFCLYLPFTDNGTTGMETPLFILMLLLSLYLLEGRRDWIASVVLGCAVLVRAEGVLWIACVLLSRRLRGKRLSLGLIVPLGMIGAGWAVFGTLYYGSPIPQNALAKSGWIVGMWGSEGLFGHGWKILRAFTLVPSGGAAGASLLEVVLVSGGTLVLSSLFMVGMVRLFRRRNRDLVWGFFFVFSVLFFILGRGATWPSWYAIPPGLSFAIVVSHGLSVLLESDNLRSWRRWNSGRLGPVLGIGLFILLLVGSLVVWQHKRLPYYEILRHGYGATGEYLASVAEDQRLFVNEIGYIGFLADRYIYDAGGMVTKDI